MPQRKVNVITERRIFGDDNDLPRDIRDIKSGVSGDSLLRYSSDTGSMTSVACLLLCILCFVFVKVTAYRHFTFAAYTFIITLSASALLGEHSFC